MDDLEGYIEKRKARAKSSLRILRKVTKVSK